MAKNKINNEDEVRAVSEISTEEVIEQSDDIRNAAPVATVSTNKKSVKIRATEDIDCIIAGIPYRIVKDKEVSVPIDVAAILCYGKKAYRL